MIRRIVPFLTGRKANDLIVNHIGEQGQNRKDTGSNRQPFYDPQVLINLRVLIIPIYRSLLLKK